MSRLKIRKAAIGCLFGWIGLWMSGCLGVQVRQEQQKTQREVNTLRREVAQLRKMVQQLSNQSSSAMVRMQLLKLQQKVMLLERQRWSFRLRALSPMTSVPSGASRVPRKTDNRVSTFVRAMMPLRLWLQRLPRQSSPPLTSCRRRLLMSISKHLGVTRIRCSPVADNATYRRDCSGLVRCIYSRLNLDIFKPSSYNGPIGPIAMFHYFNEQGWVHRGTPRVGDAVFWHGTIDRDRDGSYVNDPITHVGIVAGIDPDGRIRILHTGFGRRRDAHIVYMYLKNPSLYRKKQPRFSQRSSASTTALCSPNQRRCREARRMFRECRKLQKKARSRQKRRYFAKRCAWRKKRLQKFCPRPKPKAREVRRSRRKRSRRKRSRYRVYNSFLVSKRTKKKAWGYTTGELFAGFGTLRWCE